MKKPTKKKNTTGFTLPCDACKRAVIQPGDTYYEWMGGDICKTCQDDIKPGD